MQVRQLLLKLVQGLFAILARPGAQLQTGLVACSTGSVSQHQPQQLAWHILQPAQPALPRWKRTLDLTCIVLAAPVWVPLMGLIALGIKLVSRGPVLYRHQRIGYLGQPFQCLKFRTMKVNADSRPHRAYVRKLMRSSSPMTKLDLHGDRRLIPLGWLLRALGLDELPQLWNVLQGQMSLVGPRPCTPYEFRYYQPWQMQRFTVLPGLTGLWQVRGKNRTTFEQMVRLDIHYAYHKSLALDLWILAKTLPVLLGQVRDCVVGRHRLCARRAQRR